MKRKFVVLTHGRTGSSLLTLSLRHMGVQTMGEIFHDDAETRSDAMMHGVAPFKPSDDGSNFARNIHAANGPIGFKLFYEHARKGPAASVWDYLSNTPDIGIIHLMRRDLLAAWVSFEKARRSGVWVQGLADTKPSLDTMPPLVIDHHEISRFFDRIITARSWVRDTFAAHPFLEISYEDDLCKRFEATLQTVTEFVGASELGPAKPVLRRLSIGDPTQDIANFADLSQRFKHGPHSDYFWKRQQFLEPARHPGFCSKPFENFAIDARGKLRVCCEDWLQMPIGNAKRGDLRSQWNSPDAQAIRASILDGSYRYCNKTQCPDLVKQTLPAMDEVLAPHQRRWIDENQCSIDEAPAILSLGYDPTCNLKCPTCRDDFIMLKDAAFDQAEALHNDVIDELMPHARRAVITGQGDAFSSRLYRRFLQHMDAADYPDLKILLMTNGLSFTPSMWRSLHKAHPAISGASISVDAASSDTYAINRGGSFDKLVSNLRFLGDLQKAGDLGFLEISFVVQANNFAEMPDFVALAKEVGCSSVLFMKLIFWPGTFPRSEWAERAIHEPGHPDHLDFLTVLQGPLVRDAIVDVSNLADLVGTPEKMTVANA